MDEDLKNKILFEIGPYVSDISFFKKLLEKCDSLDDFKRKLNELLEKENDITKKTDIQIVIDKLNTIKL